jgi:hypothetical protein
MMRDTPGHHVSVMPNADVGGAVPVCATSIQFGWSSPQRRSGLGGGGRAGPHKVLCVR